MGEAVLAGLALGTSALGTGVSIFGQIRQGQIQKQQAELAQNVAQNQISALGQEKEAETGDEALRQRLIAGEVSEEQGNFQVAAAGRGVLVNKGSAGAGRTRIAAEGKYKQMLSQAESERRKRNIGIQIQNVQAGQGQIALKAESDALATKVKVGSTALTSVGKAATKFKKGQKGLEFRTT